MSISIPKAELIRQAQNNTKTEIAFIENNLTDYQSIINEIPQHVSVVLLDSSVDGLVQIANYLKSKPVQSVDAIHLFSHGSQGQINLGTLTLNSDNLNQNSDLLNNIRNSLTENADILIYGCDVADGQVGVNFVQKLAQTTGADVASSENLTGSANLGGDWILENHQGNIESNALNLVNYNGILPSITYDFESNTTGLAPGGSFGVSQTLSGETLKVNAGSSAIYSSSNPDYPAIMGSYSVLKQVGNQAVIYIDGDKTFTVTSLKIKSTTGSVGIYDESNIIAPVVPAGVSGTVAITAGKGIGIKKIFIQSTGVVLIDNIVIDNIISGPKVSLTATPLTIAENAGTSAITVSLDATASTNTIISLGATGTATNNTDYVLTPVNSNAIEYSYDSASNSVTIYPGYTTANLTLTATDDSTDENDETAIIDISAVTGGDGATEDGTQSQTVTITDDDPEPTISIADASGTESPNTPNNLDFVVTLSQASGKTITVHYDTIDGTALSPNIGGDDFEFTLGDLTFLPGETSKTISVPIDNNNVFEPTETLQLRLTIPSNVTLGTATATGTIYDDDNPIPTITNLNGDTVHFLAGSPDQTNDWIDDQVNGSTAGFTDSNIQGNSGYLLVHQTTTNPAGSFSVDLSKFGTSYNAGTLSGSSLTGGDHLYYYSGGASVGIVDSVKNGQNGADLKIAFESLTDENAIQELIQSLMFNAPNAGTYTFELTINDGIVDSVKSSFTMIGEAPLAIDGTNSTPVDNAIDASLINDITIDFNNNIAFGADNSKIVLHDITSNTDIETFTVSSGNATGNLSGTATISNDKLILNPGVNLNKLHEFSVHFTNGAVISSALNQKNILNSITDDTTYNFKTANSIIFDYEADVTGFGTTTVEQTVLGQTLVGNVASYETPLNSATSHSYVPINQTEALVKSGNATSLVYAFNNGALFDLTDLKLKLSGYTPPGPISPIIIMTSKGASDTQLFVDTNIHNLSDYSFSDPTLLKGITSFTVNSSSLFAIDDIVLSNIQNPPVITNLNGDTVQWAGVGNKVLLDANADVLVSDLENDANTTDHWKDGTLTVVRYINQYGNLNASALFSFNGWSTDIFDLNSTNALFTISGNSLLNQSSQTFATFQNHAGQLNVNFNANATKELIADVIKHIQYQNDKPTGDTVIKVTLSDGHNAETSADVTVKSDFIYITLGSLDSDQINTSDGISFTEAVKIAESETGEQTLVLDSTLYNSNLPPLFRGLVGAGTILGTVLTENITLNADNVNDVKLYIPFGAPITINSNATLTITNTAGHNLEIDSQFSGGGNIVKAGDGTLILKPSDYFTQTSLSNSYTGTTSVSAGDLYISKDDDLGTGNIILSGGTLNIAGATTIDNNISITSNSIINHFTNAVTLSGSLSGTGNLTKNGAGELTLSGDNSSYTKDITVNNGTLTLSVGNANNNVLGTGKLTLNDNTTLKTILSEVSIANDVVLNGSASINVDVSSVNATISGKVTNNGTLIKIGDNPLILTNANNKDSSGDISVEKGRLQIDTPDNLSSGKLTFKNNTALDIKQASTLTHNIYFDATKTDGGIAFYVSENSTFAGQISGIGNLNVIALNKNGYINKTLTLSNDTNNYDGKTLVSAGTLKISSDHNVGSDYIQIGNSGKSLIGVLQITESGEFNNDIVVLAPQGEIIIDEGKIVTHTGKLNENPDGNGNDLIKLGKGTLILAGDNESEYDATTQTWEDGGLSGYIKVRGGSVQIANDNNLPTSEIIFDDNGSDEEMEMEFTADTTIDNNINLSDDASFNTPDDKTITIGGALISSNDSNDFTKKGNGSMILSGDSPNFLGETKLSGGLLSVNGNLPNTKIVTVGAGATLGGSGTIGSQGDIESPNGKGAVTVASGGSLAPGNSPGVITLKNGLTLSAGAKFDVQINNDTVGTGYDQAKVFGTVNITDSILKITPSANLEIGKKFTIIDNDGSDAVVGTFKDAPEGKLITIGNKYFNITYKGNDGNDVVLTSTTPPANPAPYITSINRLSPSEYLTKSDTVSFAITFNESVANVDLSDFVLSTTGSLTGTSIAGVSGSGSTYTVTVNTGKGEGFLRVDLKEGGTGIQNNEKTDISGGYSNGQNYQIDTLAPVITIADPISNDNKINQLESNSDVEIKGTVTGADNGIPLKLNIGGIEKTVTPQNGQWSATLTSAELQQLKEGDIVIKADISDQIGNKAETVLKTITYDKTAPTIDSIIRQNPNTELTNADTLTYRIQFSENVLEIDPTDFAIAGTTGTVTTINPIGNGVYDIVISGGDLANYNGVVSLSFKESQNITDSFGNKLVVTKPKGSNDINYQLDNYAPTDIKLSKTEIIIDKSTANNLLIGQLTSTDLTVNDTFTYSLVSGNANSSNTLFAINKDQLTLTTPKLLKSGNQSILVQTKDALGHTFDKLIALTVINNNPPSITSDGGKDTATVEVLDGVTKVTKIIAVDTDENDNLIYKITGGNSQELFILDEKTGELTFKEKPKYLKTGENTFTVEVSAIDSLKGTSKQLITIKLLQDTDSDGITDSKDDDLDGDGVSNSVESAVLTGDVNKDSIADLEQWNVTSLSAKSSWATFEISDKYKITQMVNEDVTGQLIKGVKMPIGSFKFNITDLNKSQSIDLNSYFAPDVNISALYAFNTKTQQWEKVASTQDKASTLNFNVIDGGAFDSDGIANGQISLQVALAEIDSIDPTLISSVPENNSTTMKPFENIELTFSEKLLKGSGEIIIKNAKDNSVFEVIDVNSDLVKIDGSKVIINPTNDLADATQYYILIDSTALSDDFGNNYQGIDSNQDLSFKTEQTKLDFALENTTNSTTDTNQSANTNVTASINPEFSINTENILAENDVIQLRDPNGNLVTDINVSKEEAQTGDVKIPVKETLDDGTYTFNVEIKDENGNLKKTTQIDVVIETDRDGIMPSVELSANDGDFNKDGIQDWDQNNVAQLPLMSVEDFEAGKNAPEASFGAIMAGNVGKDGKVALDNSAQLVDLKVSKLPDVPMPESVQSALTPLLNFSVTSEKGKTLNDQDLTRDGVQTKVVIDLPTGVEANSYMKFNSKTQQWVDFTTTSTDSDGALLLDSNNDGKIDRIALTITDGGFGDEDGEINGTIVDPGTLVFATPTAKNDAVYSIKLANGDRIYTTSMSEASTLSKGVLNIFEGAKFDSLKSTDANAVPIYKYVNSITQDVFYAKDIASQPYDCYELSSTNPAFYADKTATGSQLHTYLNKAGVTQILNTTDSLLLPNGYKDLGVNFATTSTQSFAFDPEGFLVANKNNVDVQNEVKSLAKSYSYLFDANAVEEIEQFYFAKASLIGLSNGTSATFADVNSAFGTHFLG